MSAYRLFVRPWLFRLDAEKAHNLTIALCEALGAWSVGRFVLARLAAPARPRLKTVLAGLQLSSPIALGAGFDKNGRALDVLSTLGFGALEIGAVSSLPCAGNTGCRAIRLVEEQAVLTRYGVPNAGARKVAAQLSRRKGHAARVPVGINVIWNSNDKPDSSIDEVVGEIAAAMSAFDGQVDYVTINFACPNIRGESHFDDIGNVRRLFEAVDARRPAYPVFLKFRHRPDVQWIEALVALSLEFPWVRGFIPIVHMMRRMPQDVGGHKASISGAPLKAASLDVVRLWYKKIDRQRHVVMATGGVSSAADAFEALAAGASAVQIFTAMVYQGPYAIRRMNAELEQLMSMAGVDTTARLVGSGMPVPRAAALPAVA